MNLYFPMQLQKWISVSTPYLMLSDRIHFTGQVQRRFCYYLKDQNFFHSEKGVWTHFYDAYFLKAFITLQAHLECFKTNGYGLKATGRWLPVLITMVNNFVCSTLAE